MATEQELSDFIDSVGGHLCTFEVGSRTDPIFFSFAARILSVNHEFEHDVLQIHYRCNTTPGVSYITLHIDGCELRGSSILVKDGDRKIPVRIVKSLGSEREAFKNRLKEKPKREAPVGSADRCPWCNKKCSSSSGLTLHKKSCKKRPDA